MMTKYHMTFRALDDDWTVKMEVMEDVEAVTCLMYTQMQDTSVNVVQGKFIK